MSDSCRLFRSKDTQKSNRRYTGPIERIQNDLGRTLIELLQVPVCRNSRYTKDKQKGVEAYYYRKPSMHKERQKEKRNKSTTKQAENNQMSLVSSYLSIIVLNVSKLNFPIKGHRRDKWIEHKTQLCVSYKRLASTLQTQIGSSLQVETKREQE